MAKPIPDGYHSVTPHLVVKGAPQALEFYHKAFGAEELYRLPGPDGSIVHAEMRIGDSIVMLGEEAPRMGAKSPRTLGGSGSSILIYVKDADAAFSRAVAAGAKEKKPLEDMFWGDRYGMVTDPFGHEWAIATHTEDVPPEEMASRMAKFMSGSSGS